MTKKTEQYLLIQGGSGLYWATVIPFCLGYLLGEGAYKGLVLYLVALTLFGVHLWKKGHIKWTHETTETNDQI